MGYEMTTQKQDGKHASTRGKNFNKGYWNKKLEQAKADGDKLGLRYAKMELAKLDKKKPLDEGFKVGDTVVYFGERVKITKVHDGGYEVKTKKGKVNVSAGEVRLKEATEFPDKKTRDDVDFYTKKKLKKTGTPNVETMN